MKNKQVGAHFETQQLQTSSSPFVPRYTNGGNLDSMGFEPFQYGGAKTGADIMNLACPDTDSLINQFQQQFGQNFKNSCDDVVVTVFPCGFEGESGQESATQQPYNLKVQKPSGQNSLKEIFLSDDAIWRPIFQDYMCDEEFPNFSIYRKPYDFFPGCMLHILYMKSSNKSLSRNYNAQDLELYSQNRFYGPLVVAINYNRSPYNLKSFTLRDHDQICQQNTALQSISLKDDFVLGCFLNAKPLNQNLNALFKSMEVFTFYMFKYKSSWCPYRKESHDSKSCVYAHHMRDFRRPPEIFKYKAEDCEYTSEQSWEMCPKGILCDKSHTAVERLYHPDRYKRVNCDRGRCNRSQICAFYHNQKERVAANKMCKNYRKRTNNQHFEIDVLSINQKLIDHYQNPNSQSMMEEQKHNHYTAETLFYHDDQQAYYQDIPLKSTQESGSSSSQAHSEEPPNECEIKVNLDFLQDDDLFEEDAYRRKSNTFQVQRSGPTEAF